MLLFPTHCICSNNRTKIFFCLCICNKNYGYHDGKSNGDDDFNDDAGGSEDSDEDYYDGDDDVKAGTTKCFGFFI